MKEENNGSEQQAAGINQKKAKMGAKGQVQPIRSIHLYICHAQEKAFRLAPCALSSVVSLRAISCYQPPIARAALHCASLISLASPHLTLTSVLVLHVPLLIALAPTRSSQPAGRPTNQSASRKAHTGKPRATSPSSNPAPGGRTVPSTVPACLHASHTLGTS